MPAGDLSNPDEKGARHATKGVVDQLGRQHEMAQHDDVIEMTFSILLRWVDRDDDELLSC